MPRQLRARKLAKIKSVFHGMKYFRKELTIVCCLLLALPSCGTLGDDAFAINVKRDRTAAAIAGIQPHRGYLRVTEKNGKKYFPIEYALINGNHDLTFALLKSGSPTRLHRRSLAYNAASVGQRTLAYSLASSGYGSTSDVSQGWSKYQQVLAARRKRAAENYAVGMQVLGLLVAAAAFSGGGSSSSGGGWDEQAEKGMLAKDMPPGLGGTGSY